ncbi:hypothetical protein BGZ49_005566 [Haplosporangium sp. Z 27]|nr:hypothetical protein BGZ49_005566 [Haplosporangium sp. Z 27]
MHTTPPTLSNPGELVSQAKQTDSTDTDVPDLSSFPNLSSLLRSMSRRMRSKKTQKTPTNALSDVNARHATPTPPNPPSPVKSGDFQYVHISKGNTRGPQRGQHALPPRPFQPTPPGLPPTIPLGLTKSAQKKLRKKLAAATSVAPPTLPATVTSVSTSTEDYLRSNVAWSPTKHSNTPSSTLNSVAKAAQSSASSPAVKRVDDTIPAGLKKGATSSFHLDLQPAMFRDKPIVTGNKILRKAAGELILRATVFILSRGYAYMSKNLLLQLYRESFGCPRLNNNSSSHTFLDHKILGPIIEVQLVNNIKYYRLIPTYFEKGGIPDIPLPVAYTKPMYYDVDNKAGLPPFHAVSKQSISSLIKDFDTRFINIATSFPDLCPSQLIPDLLEFHRYLPLWYPELHPSAVVPRDLISVPKSSQIPDNLLNFQGDTLPYPMFGQLLEKGKGTGMPAKRARILLMRYSVRVLQPLEDERLRRRKELLGPDTPTRKDDSPPTTLGTLDIKTKEQTPHQAKRSNDLTGPSLDVTPSKEDIGMEIDAVLPTPKETPMSTTTLNAGATSRMTDIHSTRDQHTGIHPTVISEPMDVTVGTLTQEQDKSTNSETLGAVKPSQGSQLRAMLKQGRFKPYPSLNEPIGGSALSKNGSGQKKAAPSHSKMLGSGGNSGDVDNHQKKGKKSLGYIPPSADGIFTLPRPILPPLEGGAGLMNEVPPMVPFGPMASVGMEESNLIMSGTLLRPTRDQILKERREALEEIIEYVWRLPMRIA